MLACSLGCVFICMFGLLADSFVRLLVCLCCLAVCLLACPWVFDYCVCLFVWLNIYVFACWFVGLSVCL